MQYRRLGKTEVQISNIGLGTWQFCGAWGKQFEQSEATNILQRAKELGINFIDTAECYGHHVSETFIGNAIRGQRQDWIIATKFGHNHSNDLGDENYQPAQVLIQLEASLQALKTDYIDIYQLHSAAKHCFENDELWTMLDKQVQAGKIRFLGNSIGNPNQLFQVQQSQHYGISVIQTVYNAVKRKAEETVFPVAQQQDLGVIARVPLASGFLTGKYQPGHIFANNDVRSNRPEEGRDDEIARALSALENKPEGIAAATWANQWCLKAVEVSCVIPGIKDIQQLEENALAGL